MPLDKGADDGAWEQMATKLAENNKIVIREAFLFFLKPGDLACQEGNLIMAFLDFFLEIGEVIGTDVMLSRKPV
jgi:hypothetical protein